MQGLGSTRDSSRRKTRLIASQPLEEMKVANDFIDLSAETLLWLQTAEYFESKLSKNESALRCACEACGDRERAQGSRHDGEIFDHDRS